MGCPIIFAFNEVGSLRFSVNYQKWNAVTKPDLYPLPCMDEDIDSVGEGTMFSTQDANLECWKLGIDEHDRDKTAFSPNHGIYRFNRMPFGLKNRLFKFLDSDGSDNCLFLLVICADLYRWRPRLYKFTTGPYRTSPVRIENTVQRRVYAYIEEVQVLRRYHRLFGWSLLAWPPWARTTYGRRFSKARAFSCQDVTPLIPWFSQALRMICT